MSQTNWRTIVKHIILIIALATFLMACTDDDPDTDPGPKPLDRSSLNGIWGGEYGDNDEPIIFLLRDGDIFVFSSEDGDQAVYTGSYTYSDQNTFRTTIQNSAATIEAKGTATAENQIEVTYTSSNGSTGKANLTFSDNYYNRNSSFELFSGQWSSEVTDYSFDTSGGMTAHQDGCRMNGAISIIDPEHNLYVIDTDVTQCGNDDGQYNGLSYLYDTDAGQNQSFLGLVCNDETKRCIWLVGDKKE